MNFIREGTRLNASVGQGMRFFLIEKEINKWLGKSICVNNKVNQPYHIEFEHEGLKWESSTILLEKDFEKKIKFDMISPEAQKSTVEVYFMPCTSETEYCVEIHVMHYNLSQNEKEFFQGFWRSKLNDLRQIFNGDWVIEDRDLILSVLKSSF